MQLNLKQIPEMVGGGEEVVVGGEEEGEYRALVVSEYSCSTSLLFPQTTWLSFIDLFFTGLPVPPAACGSPTPYPEEHRAVINGPDFPICFRRDHPPIYLLISRVVVEGPGRRSRLGPSSFVGLSNDQYNYY